MEKIIQKIIPILEIHDGKWSINPSGIRFIWYPVHGGEIL